MKPGFFLLIYHIYKLKLNVDFKNDLEYGFSFFFFLFPFFFFLLKTIDLFS